MIQCFLWPLLLGALAVFNLMTMLRWFEQTIDAVEQRWWNKVFVLVVMPFTAWCFPSKLATGRATAVPHFEPARGFGSLASKKPATLDPPAPAPRDIPLADVAPPARRAPDEPPPGTPAAFLGMPVIPSKPRPSPASDPDKLARLRQKMKDQGMLGDEE